MNYFQRGHLAARGSACLEKVFAMLVMLSSNAELLLMLLVLEVLPWA
ncbi:hypothetical protein J3D47_000220 [Pseudomonas laurylsulfativorans]|nr:hypothetical protein [Pseudomonas laurylsulfativorans]MCP1415977.1 hypothetical protein [Pseudomonas laurylsulfativorans]